MKKTSLVFLAIAFAGFAFLSFKGNEKVKKEIEIGSNIPMKDKKLNGTLGKSVSMAEIVKENGLLVVFTCNTCPYVIATQERYKQIESICNKKGIGIVALNSNANRRDGADSMDEMKEYASSQGYTFDYLVDENSEMANAFGAMRTPQIFLFDKDAKLVYRGAIDNSTKDATTVTKTFLANAIDSMLKGEKIEPNSTKAIGCSIKRLDN